MDTKKLRQKILDLAIRGKLVPQDPNDEPASVLLERIKAEKERLIQEGKIKRPKKSTADTSHYQNWPFEIPESWEWVRLKDIAVIGTGSTPKTTNRDYYGGNIPWINSSSTKYEYVETPNDYITEKALKETNCQLYPIGTVVIAMYGEGKTRGQVCELSISSTTNQACAAIIPFAPTTKAYIKLFFKGNYYAIRTLAEGGLQPNLNIGKISDYWIPLPPEEEQVRIIAEANKWLSIISKIESEQSDMSSIVQETKMKVLDLAIHGRLVPQDSTDEPAIELLRRISPGIKIPCDNPHYQKLPDGWSIIPMQTICELSDGKMQEGVQRINLDVKFLRGKNDGEMTDKGKFVKAGSTMILVDGENSGEIFTTDIDGYQGSTFKLLNISNEMCRDFVLLVIRSHQKEFRENKVGSAIPHLNKKLFKEIPVMIPPLDEQRRIVAMSQLYLSVLNRIEEDL